MAIPNFIEGCALAMVATIAHGLRARAGPWIVLAAACSILTLGMLVLAGATGTAPIVAPQAGLALGGLLLGGKRLWPAILVGTLVAYLIGPSDLAFSSKLGLSLVEATAAWFGASLFEKADGGPVRIAIGDAPKVTLASAVASFAASLGVMAVMGAPWRNLEMVLAPRVIGLLIVVPMLLAWAGSRPGRWSKARIAHLAGIASATAAIAALVSFGDRTETIAWCLFPVFVWGALAFQRRGANLVIAILAGFVTIGTALGHGPFAAWHAAGNDLFGQICLAVVAITLMVLAERADVRHREAQMRATASRLREREAQLALFVDNVPSAVAILDRQMRYIAASPRYRADWDIAPDAPLIGRSQYDMFPQLPSRWREIYARVLAGEELSNPEDYWLKPDGKTEIVRWKMKPWIDAEGEIAGLMLFIELVTEAVESRRRIEAAEARYRGVFDQAAVGVARLSLEGRYLDVNDRACEILGRSRGELLGVNYSLIVPSFGLPVDVAAVREMIAGVRQSYTVAKQIRDEGEPLWILLTVSLVCDASGAPDCFVAIIQDITERKQVEAELRESAARLRLAQEAAGVGVWEIDLDRRVIIHSPVSLRLHNLPETNGELSLDTLDSRCDAELSVQVNRMIAEAVAHGTPYDLTFRVPAPGGERWVHSVGRHEPGYGPMGRIRGATVDITRFRESEGRLVEAHEKLVRLSRLSAMGAMASTLAHELNQPLTAVANYAQGCHQLIASRGEDRDEVVLGMLGRASSEALRAGAIIRKIRQFTITGEIAPKPEDLRAMLAQVWARERDRTADVKFDLKVSPRAATVLVDRIQMEQVLTNLIRNAVEAMHDSQVRSLTAEAHEDNGEVLIRLRDSGPGLSREMLGNLFDPFRTTKSNGMGLGLPICRTIVEAHGGRLWAENARGGGAAFNILLPAPHAQPQLEHAR